MSKTPSDPKVLAKVVHMHTDPEVLRRVRRVEHCCDKIERVLGIIHDLESDLHNRARNIELRVTKIETALEHLEALLSIPDEAV